MQIILAFLLFVGIIIMITLIFIGYFLYNNSKRTVAINNMLASKESDLVELYDSLEQMIEEVESYTQQTKLDIQDEIESVKKMHSEICETLSLNQVPDKKVINVSSERIQIERERLSKQYEKCVDLKSSKVRSLYSRGVSVADIAKQMSIGQGEVQLILNLKNKQYEL